MKKLAVIIFILIIFFYFLKKEEETIIAACPTFHYMLEDGGVKTKSTAESIQLFLNKEVDAFISGRKLKPNEPNIPFKIIGPGYSFLYQAEVVIFEEEMGNYPFYTDLDGVIEDFPYIQNINKVDNVYDYIKEGIIITSAENTDYSKGEVVNVINDNGERVRLSRTPIIYSYEFK